jgi:hypothetical protein
VLAGRVDPRCFFPRSLCVTGCGCYGNFLFLANWTVFSVLTSPCSALMLGQLGLKHAEFSVFYNVIVSLIQLCVCVISEQLNFNVRSGKRGTGNIFSYE